MVPFGNRCRTVCSWSIVWVLDPGHSGKSTTAAAPGIPCVTSIVFLTKKNGSVRGGLHHMVGVVPGSGARAWGDRNESSLEKKF